MGITARVLDSGEVLLPAEVGEAFGWKAGAELEVVRQGGEVVIRPSVSQRREDDPFPPISLEEFFARVPKYEGPAVSEDDIEAAIMAEARRRWDAKSD